MKPKPLDQAQLPRVRELFEIMPKLPSGRQDFARSLQDSFRQWGQLTPKQMEWVEKLIVMASATAPRNGVDINQEYKQKIPGFHTIEQLLARAAQHIAFPAIRLETAKGQRIKLYPRRNKKAVCVKVGDYSGDVSGEILDTSYLRFLPDLTDVLNCLGEMATHPVEMAAMFGKKTGSCCFCGITLTDNRSIHVGYGPICAGNYGLPWGEEKPQVTVEELEELWDDQSR